LPTSKSAAKRERQNETHRIRNRAAKSAVRSQIKKFTLAVKKSEKDSAQTEFNLMIKMLDTAAGKGIYHKNTVARKKSRMSKLLNSLN